MKTWKITLEYDGSKYRGWQEQRNARTIMGELRQAAEQAFGGEVDIQGSGRTDAGVHASAQVAHLRAPSNRRLTPERIRSELNDRLPAEIAILAVEPAPSDFHARHDAITRTYVYQIATQKSAFSKIRVVDQGTARCFGDEPGRTNAHRTPRLHLFPSCRPVTPE